MTYIKIPNLDISFLWIPRTASHAISKALLETYWPEKLAKAERFPCPEGTLPPYQIFLPETGKPETKTIVGLLRDPVERFRSACARTNHTAAEGIAAASTTDGHFKPASLIANGNNVTWFKFPDHLEEFCAAVGVPVPAVLNESETGTKPTLTAEELEQVTTTYSDDIALFEAATGTVVVEPTTEPQQNAAWDAAAAAFESLSLGKQALWEPVRVKVADFILKGDFASAYQTIATVPTLYEGMDADRATFLALFE
jgi:hypothetical protein